MNEQKMPYGDARGDTFQRETRPTLREPHGEKFRKGLMEGVVVLNAKRSRWRMRAAVMGVLALLLLLAAVMLMSTDVQARVSTLVAQRVPTVQPTPTEDATVTTLNKQKLAQEVKQLESQNEPDPLGWLRTNASIFLSTLAVVIGGLFGLWRWRVDRKEAQDKESKDRNEAQDKELEDRQAERQRRDEEQKRWLKNQDAELEKRAEERFQNAVIGLGDEKEGAQIGAAILLRTFLRDGYEQFYTQTFDLAVANLRRRGASRIMQHQLWNAPQNLDTTLPLTTLDQALIVVFKEAFPLARDQEKREPASLDATSVQLDNAYLVKADLKQIWGPQASLRKAHLSEANLSEANLIGANLNEANLNGVNLSGADLSEADLSGADLNGANLNGADLYGAHLSGADLTKAHLSEADLSRADLIRTILSKANLSGAHLNGADLTKAHLSEADLNGANLNGANLDGADLYGANLTRTGLIRTILSNADLLRANLNGARLSEANLNGARLSEANLNGATLNGARLIGADLSGADLSGATLEGARLIGADLSGADLSGATLEGAKLSRTDRSGVILSGVDLRGVKGVTKEQWAAYKAQGALVDEEPASNVSQKRDPWWFPSSKITQPLLSQETSLAPDADQGNGISPQPALDQGTSGEAEKGDDVGRTP